MTKRSDQVFDELLLLQCQQGDQKAAGLLYKRWNPRVLKWSAELLRDDDLAQEIAQESWITIINYLGSHPLKVGIQHHRQDIHMAGQGCKLLCFFLC